MVAVAVGELVLVVLVMAVALVLEVKRELILNEG